MAENCKTFVRPSGFDMVIQTSDVSLYDGFNLSCITIENGADLNDVIAAIDTAICSLNEQVGGPFPATNISYNGTTVFGCYTITGTNIEEIIEEAFTQLCSIDSNVTALDATTLTLGDSIVLSCLSFLPNNTLFDVIEDIATEVCDQGAELDIVKGLYVPNTTLNNVTNERDFVISGGNQSNLLLFATINASSYYIQGVKYTKGLTANIGLTATSDNYIDYDSGTNNYTVTAVTIGNPAPAIAAGAIRIWMLTTDGTGVTATSDLRVYGFVDSTLLLDSAVTTAKVANLAITGAKMETLGAGGTIGDAQFMEVTYDTKGRVTGGSFNVDLTGLAANDLLQWDGAQWIVFTPNYIDGTGVAGTLPRSTDANTITDSLFYDDGTTQGLNAAVASNIQFNVATILAYGEYIQSSGANATNYGYYSTVSGATSSNVGFFGKAEGELSGMVPAASNIGVVGTAITLNADVAYGARFGVDGDPSSTGKVIGLYAKAQNSGSGEVIGLCIEAGGGVFGATTKDASAILQIDSTTQGLRVPRMTTTQKNAIASPASGLIIFDTTLSKFCGYTGAAWETITSL